MRSHRLAVPKQISVAIAIDAAAPPPIVYQVERRERSFVHSAARVSVKLARRTAGISRPAGAVEVVGVVGA
jgi:hypothetical protein